MKRVITMLLIVSLIGLGVIQYRFLIIGLRLAKVQFDQDINEALLTIGKDLSDENRLTVLLASVIQGDNQHFRVHADTLRKVSKGFLRDFLADRLLKKEVEASFAFAITDRSGDRIYLQSDDYDQHDAQRHYRIPVQGVISKGCNCSLLLQLKMHDLVQHLLGKLNGLIIPCLGCFAIIIFCVIGLFYWMREQKKLDGIKNDFINNLTHELKTPVFTIGLTTRLLRSHINHNRPLHLLDIIKKQNEQMKTHIDNVLELASLENEKKVINKKSCDIHHLLQPLLSTFRTQITAKQGKLLLLLDACNSWALVDPHHFANVFHNLLDNALKYSPESPEIQVKTFNQDEFLCIQVTDKGRGIKIEDLTRIFNKFYRVVDGDLHEVKGFGLGLSYVRQVIKLHKGRISVQSEWGRGSTFTITIASIRSQI